MNKPLLGVLLGTLFSTTFIGLLVYISYATDYYVAKQHSTLLQKLGYTTIVHDTSCVAYTKSGWMGCRTVLTAIGS